MIMLLSGGFHINRPSLCYQTEGWSLIRKIVLTSLLMEFALLVQDTELKLSYIESKGEEQKEWFEFTRSLYFSPRLASFCFFPALTLTLLHCLVFVSEIQILIF